MNWTDLLMGHKGRITRKTFLIGLLPIGLLFALLYIYLTHLTGLLPRWADVTLSAFITLEALYFSANLASKRMHDYGRPAYFLWLLFAPLILTALFFIQQKFVPLKSYEGAVVVYTVLFILAALVCLWMISEMVFLRSDKDTNQFGRPVDQ